MGVQWYWERTQALQLSPYNLTQPGPAHHSLMLLVPISSPFHEQWAHQLGSPEERD